MSGTYYDYVEIIVLFVPPSSMRVKGFPPFRLLSSGFGFDVTSTSLFGAFDKFSAKSQPKSIFSKLAKHQTLA